MKIKLFVTILAGFGLLFCSCGQDCPSFPEHLKDYYPYKVGDSICFVNQYGDSNIYYVNRVTATQAYTDCYHCECGCALEFDAKNKFSADNNLSGSILILGGTSGATINLYIYYDPLYVRSLPEKNSFNPKDSLLFGKTVIFEKMGARFPRAVVEKGKGIIELYDAENDFLWQTE